MFDDARSFIVKSSEQCRRVSLWVSKLECDEAHPIEIIVRRYRKRRTSAQNARYWAILHYVAQHTGYAEGELHALCRKLFLGYDRYELRGEVIEELKSTQGLNTAQFAEYCDRVEDYFMHTLGIALPR